MDLPGNSRETYINSKDPKTGRGMTYDIFVMLYENIIDIKSSIGKINGKIVEFETKMVALEQRPIKKTGTAIIADKVLSKPKAAIVVILAIGLAFGIGFGFVNVSDINLLKILQ